MSHCVNAQRAHKRGNPKLGFFPTERSVFLFPKRPRSVLATIYEAGEDEEW
jgi:hypothetical protein